MIAIIITILFLLANAIFIVTEKPKSLSEFILEKRQLTSFKLFCTFLATNLSAFTIFGVSGAAYRMGWAFLPVMAFGTAFMSFSFVLLGIPLRRMSSEKGWITPSDFIKDRFQSRIIARIISILLLIYTLPYISIQIGSLGNIFSSILNIPKWLSSLIVILILAGYVFKGGMKSIVKTDILQLFVLYFFAVSSIIVVYLVFKDNNDVKSIFYRISQIHFRNGKNSNIPILSLLGYYLLWLTADPIFPHLTQRFYAVKSDRDLVKMMILYPIGSIIIFFTMTFLGIIGSAAIPDLPANKIDQIYTLILNKASVKLSPIFSLAAIAAIMSTLDSQLLITASILSSDFFRKRSITNTKIFVVLISLISYTISLIPVSSILNFLTSSAFTGYSSLFIIYIIAIYFKSTEKTSILLALFYSTILIILYNFKLITFEIPFILVLLLSQVILILFSNLIIKLIKKRLIKEKEKFTFKTGYYNRYLNLKNSITILLAFFLGLDIFNYYLPVKLFMGLPSWVWYHILVTIFLSLIFYLAFYKKSVTDN